MILFSTFSCRNENLIFIDFEDVNESWARNNACHLLFLQCQKCRIKFDGCCSSDCKEIYSLPIDDQKKLRKGKKNSNKIFKKGRFNQKVI